MCHSVSELLTIIQMILYEACHELLSQTPTCFNQQEAGLKQKWSSLTVDTKFIPEDTEQGTQWGATLKQPAFCTHEYHICRFGQPQI